MGMSIDEKNKFIEESKEHFKEWHDMNYIPKADYENRLKADMVAMLETIQIEASNIYPTIYNCCSFTEGIMAYDKLIQQKINSLKGDKK